MIVNTHAVNIALKNWATSWLQNLASWFRSKRFPWCMDNKDHSLYVALSRFTLSLSEKVFIGDNSQ